MLPATELDQIILSFCSEHWQKVARIVAKTYEVLEERGIAIVGDTADKVDERLAALVRSDRLEAEGNIRRWRYSEVRLPVAKQRA